MIGDVSRLQGIIAELRDEKAKLIQIVLQKEKKINEIMAKVYNV